MRGTGVTHDGRPLVIVGLTAADYVELLARGAGGSGLLVEVAQLDPRLPDLRIVIVAGHTDQAMGDAMQARFPEVWRLDQLDDAAPATDPKEGL
jgi:hypothetical protein